MTRIKVTFYLKFRDYIRIFENLGIEIVTPYKNSEIKIELILNSFLNMKEMKTKYKFSFTRKRNIYYEK